MALLLECWIGVLCFATLVWSDWPDTPDWVEREIINEFGTLPGLYPGVTPSQAEYARKQMQGLCNHTVDIYEKKYMGFLDIPDDWEWMVVACDEEATRYNSNKPLQLTQLQTMALGGKGTSLRQIKRMPRQEIPQNLLKADIPTSFDAREKWAKCASIKSIKNQGECQSCWAIAITSALDDRLCIFSEGQNLSVSLSATDLLMCCGTCGSCSAGCQAGGVAEMGYDYFVTDGIVTGGDYRSGQGCVPYSFKPLVRPSVNNVRTATNRAATSSGCTQQCYGPGYPIKYSADKLKGKAWFIVTKFNPDGQVNIKETEKAMQLEIMTNGSVTVTIETYKDFKGYKAGVYSPRDDEVLQGYHVMRCIGWGVDKVSKRSYWLLANSWGTDWGENGFMRIQRGQDKAGIESRVSAGIPAEYSRVSTANSLAQAKGTITETSRSRAMAYAGISNEWRTKLNKYMNHCKKVYRGGQENDYHASGVDR